MLDNFGFVKPYDKELYERIHKAEQYLKTNFSVAGASLRKDVLEFFVNSLIKKHNLQTALEQFCANSPKSNSPSTLAGKIYFLTNRNAIRGLNNPKIHPLVCKYKTKNGFVDYTVKATYQDQDGQVAYRKLDSDTRDINPFTFLRWAGNACCHTKEDPNPPKVHETYENVLEAFRVLYHILACHFDDSSKYGQYAENKIPYQNFYIEQAFIPNDTARTGCIMEYMARKAVGDKTEWAIIREYRKNEIDKNFFFRGYDTTLFTLHQLIDIPHAMIETKTLAEFDDQKSPYYTIAYTFSRKPQKLSDTLAQIDLQGRYDMCLRIANCFKSLHTGDKPLFHRMLNHSCIYTLDCKDVGRGWVASIVKFDFSKITTKGDAYTVFDNAVNAQSKITDESEKKYIAPEWETEKRDSDWGKVDIYSLGVLFCDILSGTILPNAEALESAFEKLPELGLDTELVEILYSMTDEMLESRPSITEVVEALQKHRKS